MSTAAAQHATSQEHPVCAGFHQLVRRYGKDARTDSCRYAAFAALAAVVDIAGAVWGALAIFQDEKRIAFGIAIATLFFAASIPLWWQADRHRKSALENRRMKRHMATAEPFLSLAGPDRETIMFVAQIVFARNAEDCDPLRIPSWSARDKPVAPSVPTP
jgi:hypothetical protein